MKNRILAVWTAAAMLSGAVAWGQGMAPVNPAFARWQREKAAKAVKGGEAPAKPRGARSPAARGEAGGEEMDFGFVPTVLDMGYLSNLNDNLTQGVGDELPSSFDLRESGAVTGVKDQGNYGNCWAFASLGSLESWVKKSEGVELDFSENHLANRHGWNPKFGAGGNAQMAEGYLLRWAGPVAESEDPYPAPGASPAGTVLRHAQRVRWIPGRTGYLDNDGIKSALMAWGGLMADYYHANGYYNAKKASYYFNAGTPYRLSNHSVLLVGWDDGYSKKNFSPEPPGDGAFIARNSWGSGWGDGGYFRISYYDESFAWGALYSFSSAEPVDNYDGVYQHDPLGLVSAIGYNGPTACGANIFTVTNASKVSAMGFYAMTPRTTYTLKVYTGCAAGQPTSGTLAAEQSGTVDAAGYVTVPIAPVAVSAGQRFSVVLQLTTPGYAYPLAMEYAVAGYTPGATAGAGESFLSANGSSWNDFTKRVNSTANFCCKAYVKAGTAAKKLEGIAIEGVNSLNAGASAAFACTARYSDGSTKAVSPKWSISEGSVWASVDASGTVTAKATDEQRTATVKAAYSEGGVSVTATWKLLVTVAAPGAPSELVASEGTEESCVRLSWSASAGASSYAVYRGTKESSGKAGYLGTVTVPRYADTAAVSGVDYRYFVKAKNGSGSSAFSEGAWGWRALAAPTELAASDGSREDRVDVTWNRSEGASHYRVWRAEGDDDFEAISGWQTACQFADGTAAIGTVYTYSVTAAIDADGTRESGFALPDEDFRTGPKTLKALEIGGPVSLGSGARGTYSCTAVYTDGTRVQVTPEWSLTGGTLSVSGANAVVTAPASSENTTATLKADYTDGVTRSASLTIMVTPAVPAAPTGLAVASADGNGITLKWNAVANASSYQLWRATADEESAVIASTTATRHTDATAVPGVAYTYRVAAANGAGAGAPCATGVTATRPIAAPTGVSASYGTFADKVLVAWRACEGAAFYRVWRAESAEGEKTAISEWQAELSFEDTSAEAGTVYYYSVQAAADAAGTAASAFGGSAVGLRKVAPKPVALSIIGPERVAAESTAAYTAKVKYDNGSIVTITPVWWIVEGGAGVTIGADGLLTVGKLDADRTLVLGARFTDGTTVETTLKVVLVAPIVKTATITDIASHARWPWNGMVDVDYTLETSPEDTFAKVTLSGYDLDHQTALAATTLSGDGARGASVAPGQHRITWNLGADYPGFHASRGRVSLDAIPAEPVDPAEESFTVHFEPNGGTGTMEDWTCNPTFAAMLPANTFRRSGFKFAGWATSASGMVEYTDGQDVSGWNVASGTTVTLYAIWKEAEAGKLPTDGLVAYYPFNGNLQDESGNGYDLTNSGGTFASDRFGNADRALAFDGQEHHAGTTNFDIWNSFSVSCWVKTDVSKDHSGTGEQYCAYGNYPMYPPCTESPGAGVGFKSGIDGISIVEHGPFYQPVKLTYNANIGNGWNQICFVVENDTGVRLYLNGKLVAYGTLSDRNKRCMAECLGGTRWGCFTGSMDDLCIYDRVLSDDEVQQVYRAGLADGGGDEPVPPVGSGDWYVSETTGNDANDGRSWTTAKKSIQAAIDEAVAGETILVADGTYAPIVTDNKAITIRSVNGADKTIIDGGGNAGCAWLTCVDRDTYGDGHWDTELIGFTLQNGYSSEFGGAYGGTLKNCILTGNRDGYVGSGARISKLHNCLLVGNYGNGACHSWLYNCTVTDNSYGIWDCSSYYSIIWGNSIDSYISPGFTHCVQYRTCISSVRYEEDECIHSEPMFVAAESGDYRLVEGSPCIDSGSNDYVETDSDFLGNARIANGTVDIGCYEYGSSTVASSLSEGLVAYWLFDGDARDASGNGNDLKNNNAILTEDRNRKADCAYAFDGETSVLNAAENLLVDSDLFSFSIWAKTDQNIPLYGESEYGTDYDNHYLLFPVNVHGVFNLPNPEDGAGVGLAVGKNGVSVYEHSGWHLPVILEHVAEIGTGWNHYVVTVSSNGAPVLYVNGQYVKTGVDTDYAKKYMITENSEGGVGGGGYGHFCGSADELGIWNRALTAEEVARLYAGERPVESKHGLTVRYYEHDANLTTANWASKVSTFADCQAFYAALTPSLATNSLDIGDTLDFGSTKGSFCHFHGNYAEQSTDYFSILLTGYIQLEESGTYSFSIYHDDGCVLYVDGAPVYSWAGGTSADQFRPSSVELEAGRHEILIACHEFTGDQILRIRMKGPSDSTFSGLPQSILCP